MTRLYRSLAERKLGGICGGLGEIFDVDPTIMRLGVIFIALFTAIIPVLITYIVAWIIIPEGKPMNDQVKDPS
jgi:phage shock protein PspC (stress-responsive transcriptional regulator)